MHAFGGSTVVALMGDILKIHVHTDTPEAVFSYAERWGRVDTTKAEDMRVQHRRLAHSKRHGVAIVTDSSADLPDSVLDRHGISLVPLQVMFGNSAFRDRVELKPEEFYRRLRETAELPTTSQPTPAAFIQAFRDARQEADEVVAVLLGSNLSGTFASAQAAIRAGDLRGIHLVDTRLASLGVGLLALRGAELAAMGWSGTQVAAELTRLRSQCGMLLTVDRYDNLLRSGRISRSKAWLAGMLDVKPILSFDGEGKVVPIERVRGRENLEARALALLDERLRPRPRRVRFGVAHADAPDAATRIREALIETYHPQDCFVTLASGVLGTHVGPGAWGIFYQIEDGLTQPLDQGGTPKG
jgi:DegV family protein with EDD domain